MTRSAARVPLWVLAVGAGVLIGIGYTLSPLTILLALAAVPVWHWTSRGLPEREQRWLLAVLAIAVILRMAGVAALFLSADSSVPYATFFGDEELFKQRTTWLRNIGMGIPISTADWMYTFDAVGHTSYLSVLAYVQALVGLAPYGVHVLNAGLYLLAALVMFRLVRPAFGSLAAFSGLIVLLFLPSLFIWSISALKEPLYFFVAAVTVAAAIFIVRAGDWRKRGVALVGVIGGAFALQSLREGGLALTAAGVGGGVLMAYIIRRPRLLVASLVILPLAGALAFTQPAVRDRVWSGLYTLGYRNWGYVFTPGATYKLLDPVFYLDKNRMFKMTVPEAGRFIARGVGSFLTVPLPWQIESRGALAYVPELMIWYGLVLLAPIGVVGGLKRDVLLTCVLLAHGTTIAMMVAMTGGNVGTLVRHRGLALPYLVWFSALGAVDLARLALARTSVRTGTIATSPSVEGGPACA